MSKWIIIILNYTHDISGYFTLSFEMYPTGWGAPDSISTNTIADLLWVPLLIVCFISSYLIIYVLAFPKWEHRDCKSGNLIWNAVADLLQVPWMIVCVFIFMYLCSCFPGPKWEHRDSEIKWESHTKCIKTNGCKWCFFTNWDLLVASSHTDWFTCYIKANRLWRTTPLCWEAWAQLITSLLLIYSLSLLTLESL